MKKLPIGRDNFKDIIEGDFYYVDKTKMLEEMRERGTYIALFPRPRRFGKSLMISTIDEFFNVEKKETNKRLFKGLYVSKSKIKNEQGKFPVIKLNFKSLKSDNWEKMYGTFKEEVRNLYSNKDFIYNTLKESEKEFYDKILRKQSNQEEYELSIKMLSQFLERYFGEKVVLLIDEYDVPIQCGYNKGFYGEVISFIKNLFGNTLKTNDSVIFSVMTGVLRVSKESIFGDLNKVKVYTAVDNYYNEYFGFTEEETKAILEHFNLKLTHEVKRMYDGYIFGNQEIYNPWSILNYIESGMLLPYWVNTSSDELLRELFEKTRGQTANMIEKLTLGKSVEIQYNEKVTFLDLNEIQTNDAQNIIGNFLLFSGYLTISDKSGLEMGGYIKVRIPNAEVRTVYTNIIVKWTAESANIASNDLYQLSKYVVDENKEKIEIILNKALQSMSFMDEHENFYHGYMLGLFVYFMNRNYIVKSNREAGDGRFDIAIERIDRKLRNSS